MKQLMHRVDHFYRRLHRYSRFSIKLGVLMMLCLYIVAIFAYVIAPDMPQYLRAMAVFHGAAEAAPACLAAGVCAGLLCDLMYRTTHKDEDLED